MKIIVLGAPGAGKGTQSEILSVELKIPAISTGAIIRDAISNNTELGKIVKTYIDKGQLVPDDVMLELVEKRIFKDDCKHGFILDGFPRTIAQANALAEFGVKIDKVLYLDVSDDEVRHRLTERLECPSCRKSYHISDNPSLQGANCQDCHVKLIVRTDDNEPIISKRLNIYHEQTEPLIDYYKKQNLLFVVESKKEVAETTKEVLLALGIEKKND